MFLSLSLSTRMRCPSSAFSWASSSSKAQLPSPRYPMMVSQMSSRLNSPKTSISSGNTKARSVFTFMSPKKDRKAVLWMRVICRQLKQRGQQILARLMAVKVRLLDEECFLCRENTRYNLILNTVCVTMYTTQKVSRQFSMYEAGEAQSTRLSTFTYSNTEMKVLVSARNTSTDTTVVRVNIKMYNTLLRVYVFLAKLWLMSRSSSTYSSSQLQHALYWMMRFLMIVCRAGLFNFGSRSLGSAQDLKLLTSMFCSIRQMMAASWPSVSPVRCLCSKMRFTSSTYSLINCCSDLSISAMRWHLATLFLQSILAQFSLGKDTSPNPSVTDTRHNPKPLTIVANTAGNWEMVNLPTMTRQTTSTTAPPTMAAIIIPLVLSASLSLPMVVNQPESSYSCTRGSTSQQTTKLMSQTMAQARRMCGEMESVREVSQMSMGMMRKHAKDRFRDRKTRMRTQRGVDWWGQYHRMPAVSTSRHTDCRISTSI